jgi:hypothetical protein
MQPKVKALAVTLALTVTVVTAAACGDDNDSPDAATAERSSAGAVAPADVAGSDQHLNNAAEELARQERVNAAASARLAGEAERQAQLEANARTHSVSPAAELAQQQEAYKANADAGPNVAEAGNRAAQQANAEAYAEQQQARAESNGQAESNGVVYGDPRDDVPQPPYVYGP